MSEFIQAISTTHTELTKDILIKKLGLFSFRGLKHENEIYEFRHPFFKKNCFKDLHFVKKSQQRKKIRKLQQMSIEIVDSRPDNFSLQEQISKLRDVVDTLIDNNNNLVAINNTMVSQLLMLQSQCDGKMNDVLKMLLNTIKTPNNSIVNLFNRVFEDFNINPNLTAKTHFIGQGAINYLNFYQTATANKASLFSLFERMNATYDMFKTHLLASMAKQTVEGLSNYGQDFDEYSDNISHLADSTIKPSILNCLEAQYIHDQTIKQADGKLYAKDDIILEELKQAHKFIKAGDDDDLPDTISLSNYSCMPHSTF